MDNESKGFIKLDRNIFNHWIFQDAEKFRAFVDLIQLARWKDEKLLIGNDVVIVPRGNYYTSELKLAERWSWSRKRTREFLKLLENEKMITKKGTTKGTMLSVENYSLYQDEGTTISTSKEHQKNIKGTTKGTSKEHQRDNEGYTKEEIKEIIRKNKNREERKEEINKLPLLSFPSPVYKDIFDIVKEIGYRTWFIDAEITSTDEKIIIKASDELKAGIIKNRYADRLSWQLKKKIEVINE